MRERDSRDRLIDATLSLCIRCGYEATTIEQIATAAEVTPPDFARYFATKDAALMAVVDDLPPPPHSDMLTPPPAQSRRCSTPPPRC